MSTRTKNLAFVLGVAAILFVGWARSAKRSAAALAADTKPAAAATKSASNPEPDCGCGGPGNTIADERDDLGADKSPENARMHRMSANLLKPQLKLAPEAALRQRAAWADRFHKQPDPLLREEIITEMVQLDDAQTLGTMLGLFNGESHPGVRDQIILIAGYMSASKGEIAKVCQTFASAYDRDAEPAERVRMLDILSNIPAAECVSFVSDAYTSPRATADDRFAAAEGLFKLAPRVKVDEALLSAVTQRLQHDAMSSQSAHDRSLAVHALAAPGQQNKAFLRTLLESEKDRELHKYLERASVEFPTN
jgi:hypothetical protein